MNILDKIVADKSKEVSLKKSLIPTAQLEQSVLMGKPPVSLVTRLKTSGTGIIAEHKRRSPSKAIINQKLSVEEVAKAYETAGVCGISILTDATYFGGSVEDLLLARACVSLPLLRKEFIIDPYQILEAKAFGADVILLIAAVLSREQIKIFSQTAKQYGLEVLVEVHNLKELQKALMPGLDMLGVNNRNLKTFAVNLDTSKMLAEHIPEDFVKVSESGIGSTEAVKTLQHYGYQGFLIGETFMKAGVPGAAAKTFIEELQ